MKEWKFGEKRETLGDQRMIKKIFSPKYFQQKYFHKNIFAKTPKIFLKKNSQNDQKVFSQKYFHQKYCHKNIFAKTFSPKIFSQKYFCQNAKNISEKKFPK